MNIRIQFDGFVEIVFSSHIIVELQLCQSPVIPRFIEIRLSGDDIVEMLDGHDVILIVIRYLPGDN